MDETKTVEEQVKLNKSRINNDKLRYKRLYNINPYNKESFNLILDSTNNTPTEVAMAILEQIKNKN